MKIEILFEDPFLLIVNKPPMILSQKSLDPKRLTVEDLVKQIYPNLAVYLHHRLDKETSGVFLFSKQQKINGKLTEMFKNHDFEKTYYCLTFPNELVPSKKVVFTNKDSGPEKDTTHWHIQNFMAPTKEKNSFKKRMVSVRSGGWKAETEFKVLQKFKNYFLVEAKPKTGRTHQIRQHLQESHRSIIGDDIYGGGRAVSVPRLMLHAKSLEFIHPETQAKMKIEASLPLDFQKLIE